FQFLMDSSRSLDSRKLITRSFDGSCTGFFMIPVETAGATGKSSGGRGDLVGVLAKASLAAGVDGLFLEVHPDPSKALCDGPTSVPLSEMEALLKQCKAIWQNAHA
ncbi:MAG: hypothetical protein AAF202_08090, partial [Pseudomonadota bacterium]